MRIVYLKGIRKIRKYMHFVGLKALKIARIACGETLFCNGKRIKWESVGWICKVMAFAFQSALAGKQEGKKS